MQPKKKRNLSEQLLHNGNNSIALTARVGVRRVQGKEEAEGVREYMWGSPSKLLAGNLQPLLPPLRPPRVEHQSVFGPLATRQLGRHPNTVSPQRHQNQKPKMRNTHEETKREGAETGKKRERRA